MFSRSLLENILFLDMETVSGVASWAELPPRMQEVWERKSETLQRSSDTKIPAEEYYSERAAIFAEFGKPVCITIGSLSFPAGQPHLKLKSFAGADETALLRSLASALTQFEAKRKEKNKEPWLCAHNGKEFDFPYLCRRYLINGMHLPPMLSDLQGKKPWEVHVLDTMELWKFGDYKAYTSLELLTAVLGIESPKGDMDGSEVGKVFWKQNDIQRIARYCEEDVIATAQVMLRFSGENLVARESVERI